MPLPRSVALWFAVATLVVATVLAYASSLSAPFVFDDVGSITENPSIRDWRTAFSPPPTAAGAVGRPLINASLALNYALGGLEVRGYRIFNLAVHLLSGLLLFGVLRRTPGFAGADAGATGFPAFAVALLWLVHPLQSESVLGVVQRSELLAGFFYLLIFYAFLRAFAERNGVTARGWAVAMVAAGWLGVMAKELVATAPVLLLLYDRTFVAGSFRLAWAQRKAWYLALAASWLPLAWLVVGGAQRGGAVGFGLGVSPWQYLLTQCEAIGLYLKLTVWPAPLVLDYGEALASGPGAVWPQALLLLALLAGTVWALVRRPALGLAGAAFFILLAPSSSFIPLVTQTIAEHRMYLPLIPLLALAVLGVQRWSGARAGWLWPAVALGLIFVTRARAFDYRTELALWTETVAQRPQNPRAQQNLAVLLARDGRVDEAIAHYRRALEERPDYADAHYNLANLLFARGLVGEAAEHYAAALRGNPALTEAHYNLANILASRGELAEAISHYQAAVALDPKQVGAQVNLANALVQSGRAPEAFEHYRAALRLAPEMAMVHFNYGAVLLKAGHAAEAAAEFEAVLRADPSDAAAARNLARARALLTR